jgi:hypothetical protein
MNEMTGVVTWLRDNVSGVLQWLAIEELRKALAARKCRPCGCL